jgi:hypothetical protein
MYNEVRLCGGCFVELEVQFNANDMLLNIRHFGNSRHT